MLSAIGRATARHAYVGGRLPIRSTNQLTPRTTAVVSSVIRIAPGFARGFAAETDSTKTTRTKATKAGGKKPAKTAAKKAATSKATAAKKKPGPPKKPLTEEEKAKIKIKELKKTALINEEPEKLPSTPWMVYLKERMQEVLAREPKPTFNEAVNELSSNYKALPEAEKQRLEAESQKNKVIYEVNFRNWVDSHTVQEIREANLARQLLKRKYSIQAGQTIHDPRYPKQAINGYAAYVKSRYHAPEFEGVKPNDRVVRIGAEWRALSPEERKPFIDIKETDVQRRNKEMEAYRGATKP
ncbi:hypothetical protein C7999DRAFT_38526 [Corynascus novoguineensis]|uniref:HMG box domain-containing protein n=1 Tax=Corynascus novoguineensis TaxID=1126955 RepID=A0AAN7D0G3_9PEZI|nr:hypothetical protein C7999DRAFT_38526 [Corynascus novoguineensis]